MAAINFRSMQTHTQIVPEIIRREISKFEVSDFENGYIGESETHVYNTNTREDK